MKTINVIESMASVERAEWDVLVGDDDPFVEHAFLSALESSDSVGRRAGWVPIHVTVREKGDRLVGALPLYLKDHSYGEFIFDFGWADAATRLDLDYYPKLVSMAPLTPATGRRFLVHPDADRREVVSLLLGGAVGVAEKVGASSVHLLFLNERERAEAEASDGWLSRLTMQYHWHNRGYESWDGFLEAFRSVARKQVRKERGRVAESGLDIRVMEGNALDARDWEVLHGFYRDTCRRKGSYPYLTPRFFRIARDTLAARTVVVMASDRGEPVAASLNFEKGAHLYGRYWGCRADYDSLHFELCYYRLIERAIERHMERFEAGAQGSHKLKRGLMPSPIHSAHFIRDDRLRLAVGSYLPREAMHVRHQIAELGEHGPYRRAEAESR